jgi:hypothetical protein
VPLSHDDLHSGMLLANLSGCLLLPAVLPLLLPPCRRSSKPFLFVYNLMVPGPPTICCVFVFGADSHPNALGSPPDDPEESSSWSPFDYLMYRWGHLGEQQRVFSEPAAGGDSERAAAGQLSSTSCEGGELGRTAPGWLGEQQQVGIERTAAGNPFSAWCTGGALHALYRRG